MHVINHVHTGMLDSYWTRTHPRQSGLVTEIGDQNIQHIVPTQMHLICEPKVRLKQTVN